MPKTREASVADALQALRTKLWQKRVAHFAIRGLMVGIGAALLELVAVRQSAIGSGSRSAAGVFFWRCCSSLST
jgi:chaperonin GroEL (HSP60 family)